MWSGLVRGATAVVRDGFDAEQALECIESDDITWTYIVPAMTYIFLDYPKASEYDTPSPETLAYGSAPISAAQLREGLEFFRPVFKQFYGQTKVPQVGTMPSKAVHEQAIKSNQEVLSSAGKPNLMADVRIVDPETGEPVPQGEQGEIAITAPYQMREYYNRPEETAETIQNGCVLTGDVGRVDEAGYLYLLGRKADMIITGGMNVYSVEVEDALFEHPAVSAVVVIGIPDADWGEAVHAIVIPDEPDALSKPELFTYSDDVLADYKKPKSIEFVDELPTTPYGKVDKVALREPYWEEGARDIH